MYVGDINKPVEILLVEDNPGDIRLIGEALKEGKLSNRLSVVKDGEEAIEFLYREGRYGKAPRPDLILLDLNLPKKDGHQVLAELRSHENLKRIPVAVMTTSQAEKDVLMARKLEANHYIIKPVNLDQLLKVVKSVDDFCLTIMKLPPT